MIKNEKYSHPPPKKITALVLDLRGTAHPFLMQHNYTAYSQKCLQKWLNSLQSDVQCCMLVDWWLHWACKDFWDITATDNETAAINNSKKIYCTATTMIPGNCVICCLDDALHRGRAHYCKENLPWVLFFYFFNRSRVVQPEMNHASIFTAGNNQFFLCSLLWHVLWSRVLHFIQMYMINTRSLTVSMVS